MYVLASLCITAGENGMADGYALWKNRLATEMVNNATKNLPPTEGPSHFVLTAHEELPKYFPSFVYYITYTIGSHIQTHTGGSQSSSYARAAAAAA